MGAMYHKCLSALEFMYCCLIRVLMLILFGFDTVIKLATLKSACKTTLIETIQNDRTARWYQKWILLAFVQMPQ